MHLVSYFNIFAIDLKKLVTLFKRDEFDYAENFYSIALWKPILLSLFPPILPVEREFCLSKIDRDYPKLRADFAVQVKDFAPPTLFVELAKDHLIQPIVNHKDEDKVCFMMGASLLKLLWLNRDKDQEFLKKLRVYGLLCGASDFDLCIMYAVFPSPDDNRDFYFVFDTSKKHLRFKILDYNSFEEDDLFSEANDFELHGETSLKYPLSNVTFERGEPPADVVAQLDQAFQEEFRTRELIVPIPVPNNLEGKRCKNVFKEGYINERALQVLEKLSELIQVQQELLRDMTAGTSPIDPSYRYVTDRQDLMLQSRSSHTNTSPPKRRDKQTEAADSHTFSPIKRPRTRTRRAIASFLEIVRINPAINRSKSSEKENRISLDNDANLPGGDKFGATISNVKCICVKKKISKYELEVYEAIKDSACFPKCFGYVELPESDEIELKLEQIVSDYRTNSLLQPDEQDEHDEPAVSVTASKMLVDLFGALISLHSVGFVHGDISPGNVGYNESKGIWQLFDFDNSRPIEEASEGVGKVKITKEFTSPQFLESGLYYPFDDFVGLQKTIKFLFWEAEFNLHPEIREIVKLFDKNKVIDVTELRRIYFKAVQVLWNQIENPSDPSIKNAVLILEDLIK